MSNELFQEGEGHIRKSGIHTPVNVHPEAKDHVTVHPLPGAALQEDLAGTPALVTKEETPMSVIGEQKVNPAQFEIDNPERWGAIKKRFEQEKKEGGVTTNAR